MIKSVCDHRFTERTIKFYDIKMEQLLLDAKRLMLKLKEDDNAADMIVTDGTNLLNRIKAMKQVLMVLWTYSYYRQQPIRL